MSCDLPGARWTAFTALYSADALPAELQTRGWEAVPVPEDFVSRPKGQLCVRPLK